MTRYNYNEVLRRNPWISRVRGRLGTVYARNLKRWLIAAPLVGLIVGLVITVVNVVILRLVWPRVEAYFLAHHWAIIPGIGLGFALTGLIMQYFTPDPNLHSTEEVVESYHDRGGYIDLKPFLAKMLAAVTTVGFGGSAALEGPSIYGGGAIGSWLWTRLRRLGFQPRDRRLLLISGAAAGMAAVFRAPLTGLVFALEMPYQDDLAHEALLPSLIAAVVAYMTMASFLGAKPLFDFATGAAFTVHDLFWSALLGGVVGLLAMGFALGFRRARSACIKWRQPVWIKLTAGGLATGVCGVLFLAAYPGTLVPIGPNYDAVGMVLQGHHSTLELLAFTLGKLAATLFSLASGGVSAMFVPLFLSGGALGAAFSQTILHPAAVDLYAAVGMAAFISAGYKTPLAAVTFVAEATGGHAFIIPALIGAAVAYAVSGDATVSAAQHLHETSVPKRRATASAESA